MHGENHDLRGQTALRDLARDFESVQARHHHVHQKNFRLELLDEPNGLEAVPCFADDFKIFLSIEQGAESLAHNAMIVRQNNPDAHGAKELLCSVGSKGNSAVRVVPSPGTD